MRPIRTLLPGCALLFAASLSHARPTILSPTVQRCDGSYDSNLTTNRDSPEIHIAIQELAGGGLKIGEIEPTVIAGVTGAIYRFNGNYHVNDSGCFSGGACAGGFTCRDWTYTYDDAAANPVEPQIGFCRYRRAGACTGSAMAIDGTTTAFHPSPIGTCPASTATLQATGDYAWPVAGKFGKAMSFNGSSNYGLLADSAQWDLTGSYTLSAWIKTGSLATQRIFSQQAGNYWGFRASNGQLSHFDSREYDSPTDYRSTSYGPVGGLSDNQWHHVAVTRGNGDMVRFYIDGQLVGSHIAQSTYTFSDALGNANAAPAIIGAYQGTSEFFNGQIDELRLMYAAYSEAGVQTEYNATVHRYSSNGGGTYTPVYTTPASNAYLGGATDGDTDATYKISGVPISASKRWVIFAQGHDGLGQSGAPIEVALDNSPPTEPSIALTATAVNALQTVVTVPSHYCGQPYSTAEYTLVNMVTGAIVIANVTALVPTTTIAESLGAVTPNQRHVRAAKLTDVWGTSPLSGSATTYTWSNAPTLPSASTVSTGSLTLSWSPNSNPGYTRYEITMSLDGFATVLSTPVSIAADHTTTSQDFSGLTPGTTYYFKIRSFNGRSSDFSGDRFSNALNFNAVTVPLPPALSGTANSISVVTWAWGHGTGASGYRLYAGGGGPLIVDTTLLSYTSSFLSPNVLYTAELETYNAFGASGRSNIAGVYTWARTPLAGVVASVSTRSVTVGWGTNLNPAYTFYEVSLATDALFAFVVSTQSTTGSTFTFDGLFPGTTYYPRVRGMNGDQVPTTPYVVMAATRTIFDPSISQSSAPASPYSPISNVIGLWHLDENSGLTALDSSGFANPGAFVCQGTPAECVTGSTPTYAAGPPDLNSAAEFSGLANTLVTVPHHAAYTGTGDMTLSAWIRPVTNAVPHETGLVVKGDYGSEAFALDIAQAGTQKRYRFKAVPGLGLASVAVSTGPMRLGQWDHVAAVFDDAANISRLYVNGVLTATASVVPSRLNAVHAISIGNRQSAAASYDRGFTGRIDEVRLMDRALSAQEVLDLYRSHFPNVFIPTAMPALRITLPPNAFGNAATLFVTNDPLNHPITVPTSVLNQGLANAPTGQVLISGSMVEIVPLVGGLPFNTNLGSSATLSFGYSDSNNDSILDGTHPQIPVTAVHVYTLNTTVLTWEQLPTTLDTANKRISATTPHFSIFALFGGSAIGEALNEVRVFPIPWQVGTSGRFGGPGLTFDKLPADGSVRIFTLSGEKVAQFTFSGPDAGRRTWNGRNDAGKPVASGLYFAQVQSSSDGSTVILKFAVER